VAISTDDLDRLGRIVYWHVPPLPVVPLTINTGSPGLVVDGTLDGPLKDSATR
jgi:hypothetical protein